MGPQHSRRNRSRDAAGSTGIDGLLEPLSRCLDAESQRRVADFRVTPKVQKRIRLLAERANEGLLSEEEGTEYEALVNATDFISILRAKAQRSLKTNGG